MPDIPPATYHLMLGDAACAEPLGDVIPTPDFTVEADVARNARAEVEQLEARVSSPADESPSSSRVPRWANAGWIAAGVLAAGVAVALRPQIGERP